jgi:uncharacterized membrane protein YphA (DoxX/SURF4 family)
MGQIFALSGRPWILWVLTIVAFLFFFLAQGLGKLTGMEATVAAWENWGYPMWTMYLVGAVELVGAVLLLLRRTAFIAAVVLLAIMPGAIVTHILAEEWVLIAVPVITALVLGAIAWMQRPARLEAWLAQRRARAETPA